ncbi:hypothetical protein C0J52_09941 [Blattella germanica]|nr:hypothetical protein C0J52_09941 [Blattella germanica]
MREEGYVWLLVKPSPRRSQPAASPDPVHVPPQGPFPPKQDVGAPSSDAHAAGLSNLPLASRKGFQDVSFFHSFLCDGWQHGDGDASLAAACSVDRERHLGGHAAPQVPCGAHVTVQVSSLTVFGSIAAVDPGTAEITNILKKCSVLPPSSRKQDDKSLQLSSDNEEEVEVDPDAPFEIDDSEEHEDMSWLVDACLRNLGRPGATPVSYTHLEHEDMSWLVDACLRNLGRPGATLSQKMEEAASRSVPVRIESLQVLTVLARKYFAQVMSRHLATLMQVLGRTLNDSDSAVAFHSGRVVDALGSSITLSLQEKVLARGPLGAPHLARAEQGESNAQNRRMRLLRHDWVGSVGAIASGQADPHHHSPLWLHQRRRIYRACRSSPCLGSLRHVLDTQRGHPVHDGHCRVRDTDIAGRVPLGEDQSLLDSRKPQRRSSAQLVDTRKMCFCAKFPMILIQVNVVRRSSEDIEDIPSDLLLKLLETSIKASQDNEKVRTNAVRAVGNFLRLVSEDVLGSFREPAERAVAILVKNASTGGYMKVRWNACYAIGNMLRNSALYAEPFSWQSLVFGALAKLVQDMRNFKVRINAALALAVPACRRHYGPHYITLWTALLDALDNSQNMDDFSEYKHRDNFLDQICISLSHLASLATKEDLSPLHDVLSFHLDTLQQHLLKFHERVVPERSDAVNAAANHASSLLQLPDLGPNQHNAAALLLSIFLRDTDVVL